MKRTALALLLLLGACARVLGFRVGTNEPFEHRAHVTEGVPCTECHAGILGAPDDGPLHLPDDEACLRCHTQPHDQRSCRGCHGLESTERRLAENKRHLRFEHRIHLAVEDVSGNCARCHQEVAKEGRTLLPRMAACLSCHAHADSFELADCDGCHVDLPAEAVRPASHLVHDEDYLQRHRLDAGQQTELCESCHTQSECAGCHGVSVPALPQRMAFSRPKLAGLHRAGFISRHAREAAADRGLCVTCHTESSCAGCHAERGLAAGAAELRNPHPSGWVDAFGGGNAHGRAARRDPVSCASCHGGAGEQLCVDCHQVGGVGGTIHPAGYASDRDERREQPCRMCHR